MKRPHVEGILMSEIINISIGIFNYYLNTIVAPCSLLLPPRPIIVVINARFVKRLFCVKQKCHYKIITSLPTARFSIHATSQAFSYEIFRDTYARWLLLHHMNAEIIDKQISLLFLMFLYTFPKGRCEINENETYF